MPVRHSPPRSLAQRIMLSFALLVTFVAGFYAFALYQSIEFTEQQLISGILRDEVARAVDTLERGETPRLPEDTRLYGAPPLEAPPPAMRGLPEGFGELSNNGDFFVHTGAWRGEPLVLTRDQLGFEDTERVFRRITLFSVLAVFFLGLLAGWILARNIMKPVKTLSDEVRKASAARTYEPLSVELTNDEVGELARICDGAMKRLHEALQREKAFTGDVSHELRTPLTVIETSAELLSMTPLSPAQAKQVERITRSAGDMRELMSLFLSFARLSNETTGPEPDSAAGILKAVADTWEPFAAEKGLALVLRREAECPGAYSPVMLGTVANNLVKNAVAYTESGVVTITETSEGFIVSDSGPGLAGDEAARIFEHGVRGSAAVADGSGAGLGLSIVSRICRRSGWTVTAGKAPEGGAAFTVTMTKAVDARRAEEDAEPTGMHPLAGRRGRKQPDEPEDQHVVEEDDDHGIVPARPGPGHRAVARPEHGAHEGDRVAPRILHPVGRKVHRIESVLAAEHHHDAQQAQQHARHDPPPRPLAVEEHREDDRQAGPQIVNHADLHGLRGVLGHR